MDVRRVLRDGARAASEAGAAGVVQVGGVVVVRVVVVVEGDVDVEGDAGGFFFLGGLGVGLIGLPGLAPSFGAGCFQYSADRAHGS